MFYSRNFSIIFHYFKIFTVKTSIFLIKISIKQLFVSFLSK